jgi:hypothetical protein
VTVPSYRVVVPIGSLRSGVAPPDVLPAVVDAVAAHADVEAHEVVLTRGVPGVQIRFGVDPTSRADEDRRARAVAAAAVHAAGRVAETGRARLLRRAGQRWVAVAGRDLSDGAD